MKFSAILTRERRSVKRTELDQSWSMNAPCSRETVWEKSTFWWTMCSKSVWALMNQSARFVIFRHKVNSANSISIQLARLFGAPLYACFKYFRQKRFLKAILQCPQELNEIVSKWFDGQNDTNPLWNVYSDVDGKMKTFEFTSDSGIQKCFWPSFWHTFSSFHTS